VLVSPNSSDDQQVMYHRVINHKLLLNLR